MDHFPGALELKSNHASRGPVCPLEEMSISNKPGSLQPPRSQLRLVDSGAEDESRPRPQTDAQLVSDLRSDHPGAPAALWNRYRPKVRRLLERSLGPDAEVADLTQEVFLRVFLRLPALRDPSALGSFIVSVALNVLKWELRRRWMGRTVMLSTTGSVPEVESTSVDAEARQALRRCYLVLEKLSTKERLAFVCRYMEGMTTEEVAAALSVSISTAKRWVNRGAAKVADAVSRDADLRSFFVDSWKGGAHEP